MIIKSVRVRTTSGAGKLSRHLLNGDDNEAVTLIQGNVGDMKDAVEDAKRFCRVYALRHFIVAPEWPITRDDFYQSVDVLAAEFGFDPLTAVIVEHRKPRAVAGKTDEHWRLVVPEVSAATGKVLSSAYDRARQEKVGRILELLFGHPVVSGAHNTAVLAALRQDGQDNLADRLAVHLDHGPRPAESFSSADHQAGKRQGIDLAQAKVVVRDAWTSCRTGMAFRKRLAEHGLVVVPGDKPGVWVIRTTSGDVFLGAAHRLTHVWREEFNSFIERNGYEQSADLKPGANRSPEYRGGDPGGHPDAPSRRGDDPAARPGDRVADAGGKGVVPGNRDHIAADHRFGGRGEPQKPRGSSPATQRSDDRNRVAANGGLGLIDSVRVAARAFGALAKSGIGLSCAERTQRHLGELERGARARIESAKEKPGPEPSKRLASARLCRDGAGVQLDALQKQLRDLEERLALPAQRGGLFASLGRKSRPDRDMAGLERERNDLRADIFAADRAFLSALAAVDREEKAEAAARAAHAESVAVELKAAGETLAEITRAQRMVRTFPGFAYSGPNYVHQTGRRVERRRRKGLRNPFARDIWGIPLDFGP